MKRELATIALSCALTLAFAQPGCNSAKDEAKTFRKCSSRRPCKKPNICIRTSTGSSEGICVYPCTQDKDCPKPFRCTGRYRLITKTGSFCRRPVVDVGGDCSKLQNGCKLGLRCFKNKCARLCKKDEDCKDKNNRCIQIVDDSIFNKGKKLLYGACLPATAKTGENCRNTGPFCQRGHICNRYKCLKTCKDDKECGEGMICDGTLYTGQDAEKRAKANAKPDHLFCRTAGKLGQSCHHNLNKSCERGLHCIGYRCRKVKTVKLGKRCNMNRGVFCEKGSVCYAYRCRKTCMFDDDCPKKRRKKGKCQQRTIRGKPVKLCL